MAEVVDALENLGELGAELKRLFGAVRLSQMANEGRLNTHSRKRINDRRLLGDHERRLREAERFNKELRAELDAMKGTAAEGRAQVKTGSMNGVRSTAGYVRAADGQLVAFTIIANNFDNSSAVLNAATDEIIVRLATHRER